MDNDLLVLLGHFNERKELTEFELERLKQSAYYTKQALDLGLIRRRRQGSFTEPAFYVYSRTLAGDQTAQQCVG